MHHRPHPSRSFLFTAAAAFGFALTTVVIFAGEPVPAREQRELNTSYFPFTPVENSAAWEMRREDVKRRVLLASGLWPMPEKTPLNAVIHGRIERDDYTVEKVFFESLPGHYVTGNLYLPKKRGEKMPAVLCPHGHWPNGRFMSADDATVKKAISSGAEKFENGARSPLQARCVQLARMGCAVFFYDMLGYADSVQFPVHRHDVQPHGFLSAEAEQRLQGYFPLQIWNGVRALDFITSLPGVDVTRIGCTGASGGGTQTMILSGIDARITAAFPCVMVSTGMQGGCTCENSSYLRIGQGNIDIAALTAPRPLGMTAADDWTKELEKKGFPDLKKLYTMLGVPDMVEAHFNTQFPHNYNGVSRAQMYAFYNRHFKLGLASTDERDYTLSTQEELSVWNDKHPKPAGDKVGEAHERAVCAWFADQDDKRLQTLLHSKNDADKAKGLEVLEKAWEIMIGRTVPKKGAAAFALGTKDDKGDHILMRGATTFGSERVDGTYIYPKNWNHSVVLWLTLKGEAFIINANGELTEAARKLLNEGYSIACPKLYMPDATRNPNVYGKKNTRGFEGYAGFHYGYNPSLFAERVHDALSMIAMIRDNEQHPTRKIIVAGVEGAGVIAAATTAMARTSVDRAVVDTQGFRFAKQADVWNVNFVPGAVKYGDVPALLSLCSPVQVRVLGEETGQVTGAGAVVEMLIRP